MNLFKDNNKYTHVYFALVAKARLRGLVKPNKADPNFVYYESHHVIPDALGGPKDDWNRVLFTAREHFVAHMLIPRALVDEHDRLIMNNAIRIMSMKCKLSSRSFAREKERINREGPSPETRRKLSLAGKGKIIPEHVREKLRKPRSPEVCRKISDGLRGRKYKIAKPRKKLSIEDRQKMSARLKGKPGRQHTEESRRRMCEQKLGRPLSDLEWAEKMRINERRRQRHLAQRAAAREWRET